MKKFVLLTIMLIICTLTIAQIIEEIIIEQESKPDSIRTFELNDKIGLKNYNTNEILIDATYFGIYKSNENFFKILNKGKYGMYSLKDKKIVIPIEYDEINVDKIYRNSVKEYIFTVKKKNKFGVIDKNFNIIFNPEYDYWCNYDYYSLIEKDSLEGAYFFSCSCFKIPVKYKNVINPYGVRGFIATNTISTDYYNEEGDLLFKNLNKAVPYRSIFYEGNRSYMLLINKENKVGLFNSKLEKFTIPQIYEQIYETHYGYFIVKKKNKFGIVNDKNEIKIDFNYDSIAFLRPYYLKKRGDESNINKTDSLIIENMLIAASKNGKFGLINRSGKTIVGFKFNGVEHLNHFYKLKKDDKCLIYNSKGKKINKQVFDDVGIFMKTDTCIKAAVFGNGRIGYINSYGKIIEPVERESKAKGYRSPEELYEQFVIALKAKDDTVLYDFCEKLTPDEYSKEFMERIRFSYRRFPDGYDENGYTVKNLVDESYKELLFFKNMLKKRNHLESIEFIEFEKNNTGYNDFGGFTTLVAETPGILKSGKKTYRYKLGELINIDGYWKSFTRPRKL